MAKKMPKPEKKKDPVEYYQEKLAMAQNAREQAMMRVENAKLSGKEPDKIDLKLLESTTRSAEALVDSLEKYETAPYEAAEPAIPKPKGSLRGRVLNLLMPEPSGPLRIASVSDYNQRVQAGLIKPGDTYIDPQGNRRVKK